MNYNRTERSEYHNPHPGLIIATNYFIEPYPIINFNALLTNATMDLLIRFAYPAILGYAKFTITFSMLRSFEVEVPFTLGPAIPLTDQDEKLIPMGIVYAQISKRIDHYSHIYEGERILKIMIRVYMDGINKVWQPKSEEESKIILNAIIDAYYGWCEHKPYTDTEPITAKVIRHSNRSYPTHITALKQSRTELKPFIVADMETIIINQVHFPYAVGLMMVRPGEQINEIMIDTYFSEDYKILFKKFEDRSTKVLNYFVLRILTIVRQEQSPLTIYFHNLSRFDGIILLKHLVCHHKNYELKTLLRNNRVYEIAVYSGKNILFRFRDSLNLLPASLDALSKNLCPELGVKGNIDHNNLNMTNMESQKNILLEYMKQDIILLGGVMLKAQEIYWKLFQVDIESKITLASLALSIFRLKYYDASHFPIHIPNKNEDSFIRLAYYGGHTDAYKPYGENLYYFDVNSLYPFVMKEFPMPGGVPVWHRNLDGMDLDSMFGFIEAYVECPKTIKKPFLPYRNKENTLIFPTGVFVGVYFSEELKYARDIGYTVIPISGYLFERKESPFKDFVSSLFESRLEAKKSKNDAMAYVYKILMNSLYGRFGINPKSTITEICDEYKRKNLLRHSDLIFSELLYENKYIISFHSNTNKGPDYWKPPENSAVQLAAAITAYARIYMYPYISREDCYYTDTDSVVLGQKIPVEEVSPSALGKFKLEDFLLKGYFLAPKAYYYETQEKGVLKFKGPLKDHVSKEIFEILLKDPDTKIPVKNIHKFKVNLKKLTVGEEERIETLGIKLGNKRKPVFSSGNWVDSEPIDIEDLSSLNHIGKTVFKSLKKRLNEIQNEKFSQIEERCKEMKSQFDAKKTEKKKGIEEEKNKKRTNRDD
ncbi:hypothetical protein CMV_022749 [Castanea mollissima]|uniref:DNA polymerase n=1 Tax=Castanea mollissima TaxID=60419 RepID=A0A8J4QQQ7_9ROSI|nr:hypothetical protein CMV_022749 [Castanea mollissima]